MKTGNCQRKFRGVYGKLGAGVGRGGGVRNLTLFEGFFRNFRESDLKKKQRIF